jgi:hypothetical protein
MALADKDREMTALRRGIALVAAGCLVLAGCDAKPTLSADELAHRANAICARYRVAYRGGRSLKTRAQVLRYLGRTEPAQRREEGELRALHPSKEQRPAVQRLLDDVHKAGGLLIDLRVAVASRDGNRQVEIIRRLGIQARRTTKEARALGWTVCATPPDS